MVFAYLGVDLFFMEWSNVPWGFIFVALWAMLVSCKALSFWCAPTVFLAKAMPFLAVCLSSGRPGAQRLAALGPAQLLPLGGGAAAGRGRGRGRGLLHPAQREQPERGGRGDVRQRSSLLKAVITAFPSVSLPFLAVPLRSHRTVALRSPIGSKGRAAIPPKSQFLLWWAGLRGAIAYGLAKQWAEEEAQEEPVVSAVMVLVVVTTFGLGGTFGSVIQVSQTTV
eukprot:SAG22_NODE_1466_length_4352_cov_2.073830_2_plen_224_part_00